MLFGRADRPCWALKLALPSTPQSERIAPGPPGWELIQLVKSLTFPSTLVQQLEAVFR